MKNKKYYIALDDREYAEIISSFINKRNSLIRLGKYTDGVDEVIMKVRKAKNRNFQILYILRKISNRISNSSCTVSFSYDTVFSFSHLFLFRIRWLFYFFKKFFYFALPIGFSQQELVKGLFLNSDQEQLFRCSLTTEYIGTSDFSSDDEPPYRVRQDLRN